MTLFFPLFLEKASIIGKRANGLRYLPVGGTWTLLIIRLLFKTQKTQFSGQIGRRSSPMRLSSNAGAWAPVLPPVECTLCWATLDFVCHQIHCTCPIRKRPACFVTTATSKTETARLPPTSANPNQGDPRAGSITISGHEEIENRLIDCKPKNKKENQYSQWQKWSLWQETERFRDDKDWDEAYFEKDHIQCYVHPLLFCSPCIQKPTKGIMSLHKSWKCRHFNAPLSSCH